MKNKTTKPKGIFLTLPEPVIKKLEQEKEKFAYSSIQEIIAETLRNKYFRESLTRTKRGRPRKIREEDILTRKRIFSKRGVGIEI